MTSESYTCELDPDTKSFLKIYLFKDVQNVEAIRNNIIQGVWSCAVIKPSLILDPFQVAVAANRAAVAAKLGAMITRTVYAEILYNLSLSKNISQSLSKFGIEKEQNLLVCFITTAEKDASSEIIPLIEGKLCPISEISQYTDIKDLKTTYKLNKINCASNVDLLDVVVSRMVTKNFVSH
ncbi:hypothetical protein MSG28_003783 [Choristoneura fumiferana]|uniref:Uncharacterized protein n=1 Tax=Choristoneura fumiferana TaxID=7141 RepID=A0ACC0KH10_CHOFU|nr:hypothetical protein MSG28_003783 [Choristoneura fumiferana]